LEPELVFAFGAIEGYVVAQLDEAVVVAFRARWDFGFDVEVVSPILVPAGFLPSFFPHNLGIDYGVG